MKIFKLIILLFLLIQKLFAQDFWQPVNLYGGEVIGIIYNHSGAFALRQDNVFRSVDFGQTWNKVGAEDFFSFLTCINSSEGFGPVFVGMERGGIWWTTNNGASWEVDPLFVSPQGQWATVSFIGINASGNVFASTVLDGHFRSNNNGQTWSSFVIQGLGPFDGVTGYAFKNSGTIFVSTSAGVFRSLDDGNTWSNVLGGMIVNSITSTPSENLFIGTRDNGIFMSSDNGTSWVQRNNGLAGHNISTVKSSSQGALMAATWGNGVYSSVNNGASWTQQTLSPEKYVNDVAFTVTSTMFAGGLNGIYSTTNSGTNWTSTNTGMRLNLINSVETKNGNKIFVAGRWNIYYSSDNGLGWQIRDNGITEDYNITSMTANNNGDLLASTRKGGGQSFSAKVFRTTNDGNQWTDITSNLENNIITRIFGFGNILTVITSPTSTSFKVFTSTNSGTNWALKMQRSTVLFRDAFMNTNGHLFVHLQDFFSNDSLLRSTDSGNNWMSLPAAVESFARIRSIAVSRFNNNLFAIRGTLFRFSTDNGESWGGDNPVPWLSSLLAITKMAITPLNGVFCGTNNYGVFTSTDLGLSWTNKSSGIPFYFNGTRNVYLTISTFAFDDAGFIYASTLEDGLFKSNVSTVSVAQISGSFPSKFSLGQNYPNPFNPETNIKFQISKFADVNLTVFDILGRETAALVNKQLSPGTYELQWDASNYPSGIYYYRLQAGDFSETKKMILLK